MDLEEHPSYSTQRCEHGTDPCLPGRTERAQPLGRQITDLLNALGGKRARSMGPEGETRGQLGQRSAPSGWNAGGWVTHAAQRARVYQRTRATRNCRNRDSGVRSTRDATDKHHAAGET